MSTETERIVNRYERRSCCGVDARYEFLKPAVYMTVQEKERALLRWIDHCGVAPVAGKRVVEIGCGSGANLLQFQRLGFRPENLVGNELLPQRAAVARQLLPSAIDLLAGDAMNLDLPDSGFDIVLQSTVFTSILDDKFQQDLAARMWRWVKPGGGVLWYDFTYNNPKNPDVRGVPLRRVRGLFPTGQIKYWRVTLAPPISRVVTRVHPTLYTVFNALPILRTHLLCWIKKSS